MTNTPDAILTSALAVAKLPCLDGGTGPLRADALAARYGVAQDWVARGLEACARAGVAESYFVRRYLDEDASVPLDARVDQAMRALLRDERNARLPVLADPGKSRRVA